MLHFDVMDGIFVNNITFGLPVLEMVRKSTDMTLDVHLMITDPLKYAERFASRERTSGHRRKWSLRSLERAVERTLCHADG